MVWLGPSGEGEVVRETTGGGRQDSSLALISGRRERQVQDQGVCEAGAGRQAEGCVSWRECQGAASRKSWREDPGTSALGGQAEPALTLSCPLLQEHPRTPP